MKLSNTTKTRISRGFTLVELLVTIAIVAALAAVTFTVIRKVKQKAQLAKATNGIKECGGIIMGDVMETHGKITVFTSGTGQNDLRLIGKVINYHGLDRTEKEKTYEALRSIIYTPAWDPGKYDEWSTYGINVDDNEDMGVVWERVRIENSNGKGGNIQKLSESLVKKPGNYPFIADSSDAEGTPRLRFGNDSTHQFALRYGGKGIAMFLDGSIRVVSKRDMAKYGITRAWLFENGPKSKPTMITAD